MTVLSLFPLFMVGLLGSVHCVGMCGGIVSAFSVASTPVKKFPVAVIARRATAVSGLDGVSRVVAYNVGRIGSYAIAGAIVGGFAGGLRFLVGGALIQAVGYWLANLMLVALGLYLMDAWRGIVRLESIGQALWRRIQPLMKYLMPLEGRFSPLKMFALGGLWGWLPCGMVYSVLLTAMLSGSALSGAAVMLAFGLGTLPTLLAMGMVGARLKNWLQRRPVRVISGVIVLSFGVLGLYRAAHGLPVHWLDTVCTTVTGVGDKP
ncbi:sulfite exporter TauE/SafE family protein [Glaciimonas sp. PCH181]|uniref:sulfite exporter TauE/SafE family protein n=1 Tax=Glaciimonas sp. PCH181 TaxID=2133943 RepID=UPI000D378823|nr:sulfite exporter TauE/SafE family protein [Glaciimonas sp. PCH181]PUA19464.1 cytochrome biogenesis protein [Glaciimonas sp. PCH181]